MEPIVGTTDLDRMNVATRTYYAGGSGGGARDLGH